MMTAKRVAKMKIAVKNPNQSLTQRDGISLKNR